MGRITGSASIETLVRVGIEKEHGLSPDSKMVVLHDFTPCVDDELEVKRGQIVNILYRENDWVYVIGQDSRQEGFIPHSYCAPYNTQLADLAIKKKLPREQLVGPGGGGGIIGSVVGGGVTNVIDLNENLGEIQSEIPDENSSGILNGLPNSLKHSQASLSSEPDFLPFAKDPSGRYIVLYTFIARDENDVSVERGEFVTVLNREDPDWYWIVRSDGQEGFIPSGFVYPAENILQGHAKTQAAQATAAVNALTANQTQTHQQQQQQQTVAQSIANNNNNNNLSSPNNLNSNSNSLSNNNNNNNVIQTPQIVGSDDLRYHGTELVMLYDYKAQAPDDLSVRRGDWIYADLNNQTVDGWLWAYAPKTRKYGFIPKAYARPPAMTSL